MKIVLNSYNGHGINGMSEVILEVTDYYDKWPNSLFYGNKVYHIPVSNIAYVLED